MASQNGEYVCTLSPETVEKAEKELNEKPQWRNRDIQALRDMVLKKKELKVRTDDAFLLRFLRARKFDYDRAFNLLLQHYTMKADNPDLFSNLRPSTVKTTLEDGVTGVLPHRDKEGRRVMIFRPGRWDPDKYPLDDVFKTNFMSLYKIVQEEETQVNGVIMFVDLKDMGWKQVKNISPFYAKRASRMIQRGFNFAAERRLLIFDFTKIKTFTVCQNMLGRVKEEETQVHGIIMFMDLKDIGWKQVKNISPFYAKRIFHMIQDCFPLRFKGIHYINEPSIFDYIFAIVRPFMKEKLLSRLHFHGPKYEELKEFVDEEYLPSDYGGKGPEYTNKDWADKLLQCDAEYDAEAKYGLIQSKGVEKSTSKSDAMDSLAGTFRKLET